jgi:hypothetical protein
MDSDDTPSSLAIVNPSGSSSLDKLPEDWRSFLQENHDALNIEQLQAAISYLSDIKWKFQESLEKGITIEDFEKAKKQDADGDNEEGEK